jgi:PhnB protein
MNTSNKKLVVEPYLYFDGHCDEALEFYKNAVGAEVTALMRFKDAPAGSNMCEAGGSAEKVMHCNFRIGNSTVMASDGRCSGKPDFQGFSLSLTAPTKAEAERLFAALSTGGQVQMPLAQTFFSPGFGMVIDRFGVCWAVVVQPAC